MRVVMLWACMDLAVEQAPKWQPTEATLAERRLRKLPRYPLLVVDDDEDIRNVLTEILDAMGYEVTAAVDGQEAIDLLELGLEPKAIVLDMMMPRMDGWAFLSRIRKDPRFQDVPVVVATAATEERPAAADALLRKPFDVADLAREIARLCAH